MLPHCETTYKSPDILLIVSGGNKDSTGYGDPLQTVKHTIEIKAENRRVSQLPDKNSLKLIMFLLNWSYMLWIFSSEKISIFLFSSLI